MTPHEGPIRWGIAATGKIAQGFASAFANLDDGELAAVGSRSIESADEFADAHGIPRRHGSYADLAADPDIDVVYVASPQSFHRDDTVAFLNAGKHVLCEKPFALSAGQVDDMIAAATANDRFLMEAMWMRFQPLHVELKRRVDDAQIGELRRVIADFSIALPPDDLDHRLMRPDLGGGALLDLGVYPFGLAWWFLGPPTRLEASGRVGDQGVDTEVSMLGEHANGSTSLTTTSIRINGSIAARIEGSAGTIDIEAPLHCGGRAVVRTASGEETVETDPGSLHHQAAEVMRCLRAGERESARMPLAESRAILATLDDVRAGLGLVYPGGI